LTANSKHHRENKTRASNFVVVLTMSLSLKTPLRIALFLWFVSLACDAVKTAYPLSSSSSDWGDGAPWQTSNNDNLRSLLEESTYEDLPPTVFSPTGRLHSVERVVKAAKSPTNPRSNLLLALHCQEGLVVISTIPTSPHLNTTNNTLFLVNETSSIPYIFDIHPSLTAATAGNAVDGQVLRTKIQAFCEFAMETQGEDAVQASVLARRVADHLQVATQTVGGRGGRMLAVR
jgi:hypothetical protein